MYEGLELVRTLAPYIHDGDYGKFHVANEDANRLLGPDPQKLLEALTWKSRELAREVIFMIEFDLDLNGWWIRWFPKDDKERWWG